MEHPFAGDLNNLNSEELSTKINELYNALRVASSTGNGHLCHQIRLLIETYQTKYQSRIQEENGGDDDFQNNVDIS